MVVVTASEIRGIKLSLLNDVHQSVKTVLWNDSADPKELEQSIKWGAVGATCNPIIALTALKEDSDNWQEQIRNYARFNPSASDDEIGWQMIIELSKVAAKLLEPAFSKYSGRNGRLSIQTDPRLHRNPEALIKQAEEFTNVANNIIVKIPTLSQTIDAFEEATYLGISINATVSFSVAQTIAVAEAVERGLKRREAAGLDISNMGPVCTIMVGRTDDWLKASAAKEGISIDPNIFDWAGIATFKNAYRIYQENGYRTRLLVAAFRSTMHWSELLGGACVISPPFTWQEKINKLEILPDLNSIAKQVDPKIINEMLNKSAEFRKAFEPDGMKISEFSSYGATRRTLRGFLQATNDLELFVRDTLLLDPDI